MKVIPGWSQNVQILCKDFYNYSPGLKSQVQAKNVVLIEDNFYLLLENTMFFDLIASLLNKSSSIIMQHS